MTEPEMQQTSAWRDFQRTRDKLTDVANSLAELGMSNEAQAIRDKRDSMVFEGEQAEPVPSEKMFRLVVYCKDLNGELGRNPDTIAAVIEQGKYGFFQVNRELTQVVDIGQWTDDHPLNKIGADCESWFKK